jgi:hypothetical protein
MSTFKDLLTADISNFFADPLGYVMYIFPWDTDLSIQQVELEEPYASKYRSKYGPDRWACEFLDDLGREIRKRGFDGRTTVEPIRFSTASGHGIGKSALVSWLILFILDTRPFSKGVVTANTGEQLRTKTWAELGKWHRLSMTAPFYDYSIGKGSMSLARKEYKERWRADAQTCREENSESFQGLHAAEATPFYIFDEASGIPEKIWNARAGGGTDGEHMTFDFGNPTRNTGTFYENCVGSQKHRFIVRSIDSREVQITNKALFQEWIEDYGEDSDFVKVKVRGMFPSQSSVQFINSDDVQWAMDRPLPVDNRAPLIIGVDVARFGDNDTVIYPRIGDDARSFPYKRYNGLDNMQVADKVVDVINEFRHLGKVCTALFIDGGGMGSGPIDRLRQLGYNPIEVQFGSRASDRKYRMKGDEIWGRMREGLKNACLPRDDKLRAELVQREYGFTPSGLIALESKSQIKKRGGESPDIADALALSYSAKINTAYAGDAPQTYKHDYDVLEQRIM